MVGAWGPPGQRRIENSTRGCQHPRGGEASPPTVVPRFWGIGCLVLGAGGQGWGTQGGPADVAAVPGSTTRWHWGCTGLPCRAPGGWGGVQQAPQRPQCPPNPRPRDLLCPGVSEDEVSPDLRARPPGPSAAPLPWAGRGGPRPQPQGAEGGWPRGRQSPHPLLAGLLRIPPGGGTMRESDLHTRSRGPKAARSRWRSSLCPEAAKAALCPKPAFPGDREELGLAGAAMPGPGRGGGGRRPGRHRDTCVPGCAPAPLPRAWQLQKAGRPRVSPTALNARGWPHPQEAPRQVSVSRGGRIVASVPWRTCLVGRQVPAQCPAARWLWDRALLGDPQPGRWGRGTDLVTRQARGSGGGPRCPDSHRPPSPIVSTGP